MSDKPRARHWALWGAAAAAAALVVGRAVAALYVDHAWYASMDALDVWAARFENQLILRGGLFTVATAFVFANVQAVRNSVVSLVLPRRVANLEIGEQVSPRMLTVASLAISVALGVLLAAAGDGWTTTWATLAAARDVIPFGERDPYFDADMRFYVAWLPLENGLYVWSLLTACLGTAVTVFLYALTPSLRWEGGRLRVSSYVRRHFASLGGVFFALLAWSYRLDAYGALISDGTTGFTWVDHRVVAPASMALGVAAMFAGCALVVAGWRGRVRPAFVAVTVMLVLAVIGRELLPFLARETAGADWSRRQRPYDDARTAYTRRAFGANDVIVDDSALAFDSLPGALDAASAWDAPLLRRAVGRARAARVEGDVASVARARALLVALGPLDDAAAATGAGWSVALRNAASADQRGAPLIVEPTGTPAGEDVPVAPVRVWDASLAPLALGAADDGSVVSNRIEGWAQRAAHAWSEQELGLLRGERGADRIMLHRALRDRVSAIMPFFQQGASVSPALLADTLYWVLPLYSASSYYPLSDALRVGEQRWTYVRHAATALVQSSTGRVTIVADSQPDAVTRSWVARFPGRFTSWNLVAPELRAQVPPTFDAALGQASAYAHYGSRTAPSRSRRAADPAGTDASSADASSADAAGAEPAAGGHDVIALRDGRTAWPIAIVNARDEVDGLLLAIGGPQSRTVFVAASEPRVRWSSVGERLQAADERRVRESVDSVAGTRAVAARARAVPLAGGAVAFVRSVYRSRSDGAPALDHVSVVTADSAWSLASLAPASLAVDVPGAPGSSPAAADALSAPALYDSTRAALRRGDWSAFGRAYDALGRALRRPAP